MIKDNTVLMNVHFCNIIFSYTYTWQAKIMMSDVQCYVFIHYQSYGMKMK